MFKPTAGNRGYTFIELLVVLAILAVLAGTVVLSLTMFVGRGGSETCEADQSLIQSAVVDYLRENEGSWPTPDGSRPGDLFFGGPVTGPLVGDYIHEVPDSDVNCDWRIDAQGMVVPNNDDCPCD